MRNIRNFLAGGMFGAILADVLVTLAVYFLHWTFDPHHIFLAQAGFSFLVGTLVMNWYWKDEK